MSRFEPAFMTKTLELFYRTFDHLGYTESDIARMLEEIENRHGVSTHELHKKAYAHLRDRVDLTPEMIDFLYRLGGENKTLEFCKKNGVAYGNIFKIRKRGWCSKSTYKKIKKGMERWTGK